MSSAPSSRRLKPLQALIGACCGWLCVSSAVAAGVGNLVYLDSNNNGAFDSGEGLNEVTVQLYGSTATPEIDPPLLEVVTASGGQFLFAGLADGEYFLHVPSSQFSGGGVLESLQSMAGVSMGLDDDAGEDGEDAVDPTVTGVRTSVFNLTSGTEPTDGTFETGGFAATDNAEDADVDLTVDFGFRPLVAASFPAWQTDNPLSGSNLPTDDPDGDSKDNVMEYALADTPDSAVASDHEFTVTWVAESLEARFVRSWGGHSDLAYIIEGTTDEPTATAVWTPLSAVVPVMERAAGEETVTYAGLQNEAIFSGETQGFLRLRVDLDADGNSTVDATSYSPAWGFATVDLVARNQTFGMPLANRPIFSGGVDQVNGSVLDLSTAVGGGSLVTAIESGSRYFVEVTSGDDEGHRWEVDESSVTATSVTLEPTAALSSRSSVPSELAGQTVVIRPYWLVNDLFSGADIVGTTSQASAPKITFYDSATSRFTGLWRFSNGSITRWLADGVASLADAGVTPLDVCRGWFINPRSPATVRVAGVVRTNLVACAVTGGTNLISIPSVVPKSPLDYQLIVDGGLTGSTDKTFADRLRFWRGDTEDAQGYYGYWLYKTPSLERWLTDGAPDLTDFTQQTFLLPFRGVFLISANGLIDWKMRAIPLAQEPSKENGPR